MRGKIYEIFSTDDTLIAMLPGGVFSGWTAQKTALPRLNYDLAVATVDRQIMGGTLSVNIYVPRNEIATAEAIGKRVERLLEGETHDSDQTGHSLRIDRFSTGLVYDDVDILQYLVVFEIRGARKIEGDENNE